MPEIDNKERMKTIIVASDPIASSYSQFNQYRIHILSSTSFIRPYTMCRRLWRYRSCQHYQRLWRPGPRSCPRAIRENARSRGHREIKCSLAYQTFTQSVNMTCQRAQCRRDFKVSRGFICCQCKWRNQIGQTQCHGPPDRHEPVTDIWTVRSNTQYSHSVCHTNCWPRQFDP
ncbi:hypothetical protein EJ08DRAFT_266978 [Tothia fuscella]|uniref:Uncharacterized protein n=1 Tax=Tothia fuscella TaxID=1048955 RepID=A0A9P4NR23_9PEZI|nr:hypothetical protein EJ08DRAFT_266978 [Tothia fuscella]